MLLFLHLLDQLTVHVNFFLLLGDHIVLNIIGEGKLILNQIFVPRCLKASVLVEILKALFVIGRGNLQSLVLLLFFRIIPSQSFN